MKRELPLLVTALIGLFMILSFFVPHQWVSVPADFLQATAIVLVACGYVLGGANVLRVNLASVSKREPDWPFKVLLVVSLVATVIVGALDGVAHGVVHGVLQAHGRADAGAVADEVVQGVTDGLHHLGRGHVPGQGDGIGGQFHRAGVGDHVHQAA